MLTIRHSQLQTLAEQRICDLLDELVAMAEQGFPAHCEAIGSAAVRTLLSACITTCREQGVTSRTAIMQAVESLFQNSRLASLSQSQTLRMLDGELQARRLCSMFETLADLHSP
jgi:hypothetical protein